MMTTLGATCPNEAQPKFLESNEASSEGGPVNQRHLNEYHHKHRHHEHHHKQHCENQHHHHKHHHHRHAKYKFSGMSFKTFWAYMCSIVHKRKGKGGGEREEKKKSVTVAALQYTQYNTVDWHMRRPSLSAERRQNSWRLYFNPSHRVSLWQPCNTPNTAQYLGIWHYFHVGTVSN